MVCACGDCALSTSLAAGRSVRRRWNQILSCSRRARCGHPLDLRGQILKAGAVVAVNGKNWRLSRNRIRCWPGTESSSPASSTDRSFANPGLACVPAELRHAGNRKSRRCQTRCSQTEDRTRTAPRLFTSIPVWQTDTEPISLPKSFFVFLQQGRQRQPNLRKRSEIMVALGGVRRDQQLFRFGALKLHATRSHSQGISPAQSSLDLRVSTLCSAAHPSPPINGIR